MTRMMDIIKKQEALDILLKVLSIPSVNGKDNEGIIAQFICDYLNRNDVEAEVQYIDETHSNVIAKVQGQEEDRCIIWNGHLDTVPYGNLQEWLTNPELPVEIDNRVYGRGASDMKSGLAAMVYALCQLKKRTEKPQKTIYFIGTCDEEKGGLGAECILKKYDFIKRGQLLLIGEPTGCNLGVAQKGCIWIELHIEGKTSHGAYPKEGLNAVESGFQIISELKEYISSFNHEILGESTMQITGIEGGVANNMTPDKCKFILDIRVVPQLSLSMIEEKLLYIVEKFNKGREMKLQYSSKVLNSRIAIEISKDNLWLKRFEENLLNSGDKPKYIGINYFTDGSILAREDKDLPVLLFGPGEPSEAHKPNEWVDMEKYYKAIDTLLNIF
ncbi:MAG: M20 family metallopeptidase [Clostridium sp.]|nr:M20 family metallopeptidase [Clostridium sp.]MDU7083891.1 M20 family metallopeptidase [Clostridium sp.]